MYICVYIYIYIMLRLIKRRPSAKKTQTVIRLSMLGPSNDCMAYCITPTDATSVKICSADKGNPASVVRPQPHAYIIQILYTMHYMIMLICVYNGYIYIYIYIGVCMSVYIYIYIYITIVYTY